MKRLIGLPWMACIILIAVISPALLTSVFAFDLPDICKKTSKDKVYTLYRNSILGKEQRFHVGTFDADVDEDYNRENCKIARDLFQNQPGVMVEYWCEKGYLRK